MGRWKKGGKENEEGKADMGKRESDGKMGRREKHSRYVSPVCPSWPSRSARTLVIGK